MTIENSLVHLLEELLATLLAAGELSFAAQVSAAVRSSPDEQVAFLRSNELWGGAGSIADQAGVSNATGNDRANRRAIESALVRLGREQLRLGIINVRTSMWIDAFEHWKQRGI